MAKGVSIKFRSYEETVPVLLNLIHLSEELKKHTSIVLKPSLKSSTSHNTSATFVEAVLKFCAEHKNQEAKIYIAEGSDGEDTLDVFESAHYHRIAEQYNVSLIDLNTADAEEIQDGEFLHFSSIIYPQILSRGFVITLPRLISDSETDIQGSLSTMLGAFPASHYKGFFSPTKNKIRKHPIKYSIHDIIKCKMPDLTIIDAADYGAILAGNPLEMDKRAAKLLGKDWKTVAHLRLVDESISKMQKIAAARIAAKAEKSYLSQPAKNQ